LFHQNVQRSVKCFMAAGFEQQDYKGATNTVLGFSWLLSWLHGTRGCSWQTAEADTLRFHPRIRGAAILFPCHHSSYFQAPGHSSISSAKSSSIKDLLKYRFYLTSPSCFVRLAHDLNPFNTFQPLFRFPVVALFEVVDAAFC
jgi:hypothetical protein